jgi:hypothetical protein
MLTQKLLIDVSADTFATKNRYLRRKSADQSSRIASFFPWAVTSGPGHHLEPFSS